MGLAHVCRFPERKDYPWREQAPDDAVVAQRCEALGRIVRGDNCIMVASARALLRCVPPVESRYWESTTFAVGEEIPFDEVPQRLVGMGYTNAGAADAPGLFRVHGDTVEVFPAQEKAPVRIEFFGDEIDRIRRMVSSTGQTIGNEDSIEIFPCRELALTDEAVHNMHVALYRASQDDSKLAALLEMVDARIVTPELDRFLPVMYGQTVSPLAHVSGKALVVLSEPRSLFDDCLRAYEDIEARAGEAGIDRLDGLYVRAQQLDFGAQQRLNYVSLIRAGGAVTAELKIEQPAIAGSDNRFMTRIQEVVGKRYACVFAIPDRGARESMDKIIYVISVATIAIMYSPNPKHNPIHVTVKRDAAVVNPFTLKPSLKIVPAPKKPIPDNNCAGILLASAPVASLISTPKKAIKTALIPSKTCVLKPAGLFQDSLSQPIRPAKTTIITSLNNKTNASICCNCEIILSIKLIFFL